MAKPFRVRKRLRLRSGRKYIIVERRRTRREIAADNFWLGLFVGVCSLMIVFALIRLVHTI